MLRKSFISLGHLNRITKIKWDMYNKSGKTRVTWVAQSVSVYLRLRS